MEFSDLYKQTKGALYSPDDILNWTPPKRSKIIDYGLLDVGGKMMIFGAEGSWKSILAMHTQYCVSHGIRWLGLNTFKCNTLRFQAELPKYQDRNRIEKYCIGTWDIWLNSNNKGDTISEEMYQSAWKYSHPPNAVGFTERSLKIDETNGWENLRYYIELLVQYFPDLPILVILDPLFKMFSRNISDEQDVNWLLDKMDRLMDEVSNPNSKIHCPGLSFIIIHHTRKSKIDDQGNPVDLGSEDATGNRVLMKWSDTILRIDPEPADETQTHVTARFTKHRNLDEIIPTKIKIQWDKNTLHPKLTARIYPTYVSDTETEDRGRIPLAELE